MLHYKLILVCCGLFAILKLNNCEVFSSNTSYNSSFRSDDYISINKRQYDRTIKEFDHQMEIFKQLFNGRLNTLDIQLEMLVDSLKINDELLNPMEILSDFSKHCVTKYRPRIPTIEATKTSMQACVTTAKNQLNNLLNPPLTTRNNLQNYYRNNFEKEIKNCATKHANMMTFNYTNCLTGLISSVNVVTLSNQKTFNTQIESAQCSANTFIKKAIDCSFLAQNRTLSLVAEANTLINKCLENLNNSEDFCSDVFYMRQAHVDHKNFSMTNPFYGRNESINCLLIKLY
ncbi:uncharacterized protein LOC111684544 [Lucilia cuprina]|uniref:uncharacterized protein LOC111684544 n=1 Tax=Lucilia cuprina TaxID=7375 RepID=UPI001F0624B5|nr:uncharacterized protein LOC111684544 [Lucilia cuprina]